MKPLDLLSFPTQGLALIEASAGTGKTYTIASLYLRLLLERGLAVDQILVVTFTQAATEELRERIRQRLSQALARLEGRAYSRQADDPVLNGLLLGLPDRPAAAEVLSDALARMDEAAIHTIHGFCQRMLQENAFDSGTAFELEFISDESRLRAVAAADFWRTQVAVADPPRARWIRRYWRSPEALLEVLQPTLALDDVELLPPAGQADVDRLQRIQSEAFSELQTCWHEQGEAVKQLLASSPNLNRRSYKKPVVVKAIAAAERLAAGELSAGFPPGFDWLLPAKLAEKTKPGASPPDHRFFDLCQRLWTLSSELESGAYAQFLISARRAIRAALERHKGERSLVFFDDLLRHLDRALAGGGGEGLARRIRRRYPLALIDEFQDTDSQQYRIFHRIYAGQPDCGLFLIGDPKQAIYGFRGGDIFAYMQARDEVGCQGAQFTLGINWRAGSRLVRAVNTLFTAVENPFIYAPQIEFHPVAPRPDADLEPFTLNGEAPRPLQFRLLPVDEANQTSRPPGYLRKDAAQIEAARACAEQIAELLNAALQGRAMLGSRPLEPGDIALLVRTHREGEQVRSALAACAVSSVSLSQESVFLSEDAEELAILLAALAEPGDEGRVRAALATGLMGRSALELERLIQEEKAWESVLDRFRDYRERWQRRGCMVALQEVVATENIAVNLLRRPDGERRLTNLLQLIELLQPASRQQPGIEGLLRWFSEQRMDGLAADDASQLRLESDEGLVKVVTMHKSKGLEYPLVFIPFPWSFHQPRTLPPPLFHAAPDNRLCLDLGSSEWEAHQRLAQRERLAERLRLLYVALTRAARYCVLCWGRVKGAEGSALAHLLHTADERSMAGLSEAEIVADLDALASRAPESIAVEAASPATGVRWTGRPAARDRLSEAGFVGRIDTTWRIASYSALVRDDESEQPDYDPLTTATPTAESSETSPARVFELPAGTRTGHFLHQLFEQLDFPQARGESLQTSVRALLARYGQLQSVGRAQEWTPVVAELVTNVLDTQLDSTSGLCLRAIPWDDRLNELEFHFSLAGLDPAGLQRVLATQEAYACSAQGLGFEPMRGLMRGFIDLVFRFQGRYFILDYKSNLLGRQLSDYGREGMGRAIRQHRYDLQYLLYTLALHRFLGQRLPGYDYQHHFGGVYYLFLRGMRASQGNAHGVWYERPRGKLIDRLDRLFRDGRVPA